MNYIRNTENVLIEMINEYDCSNQLDSKNTKHLIQKYARKLTPQPGEIVVPYSAYDEILKSKPKERLNPVYFIRKNNNWIIQWKPQNAIKAFFNYCSNSKAIKYSLIVIAAIVASVAVLQMLF